jgi:hypothetical protein
MHLTAFRDSSYTVIKLGEKSFGIGFISRFFKMMWSWIYISVHSPRLLLTSLTGESNSKKDIDDQHRYGVISPSHDL